MHDLLKPLSDSITILGFLVVLSYYALLLLRPPAKKQEKKFLSLTVIVPAHNEATHIKKCLLSILEAQYEGLKEIIVVDDGSTDDTTNIVEKISAVRLIKKAHTGKADSLNLALKEAQGEVIATVDADTEISPNTLLAMQEELEKEGVVAATCPIAVRDSHYSVLMWLHIEQLYSALLRSIMTKINANITNSGQCAMFRKAELMAVGGFPTMGLADDMNIAISLIRQGNHLSFCEKTIVYTNMPNNFAWFIEQRFRWARGPLNTLTQHWRLNNTFIDLYTLPLMILNYVQALVMGSFTAYQIWHGYYTYYYCHGEYFSLSVLKFFLDWCSIFGLLRWLTSFFTGQTPLDTINILGALGAVLTYPLFIISILKFEGKFTAAHLVPLCFMAPFWWLIMLIQILSLPEIFKKDRRNIWTKPVRSLTSSSASISCSPSTSLVESAEKPC